MRRLLLASAALLCVTGAHADGVTVETLLKEGYEIRGVFQSTAGPGILLQRGTDVTICFVAETPGSDAITTQYCKPVH